LSRDGAVLLLHGQPGSARDWDPLLAALGGSIEAIAPDRPGWDGRGGATDLSGNAEAAIGALDARGIERAVVVGHSFGGAVAAWLALRHRDRVSALVLAAPSANARALYALDYLLAAPLVGPLLSAAVLGAAGAALGFGPARRRLADHHGLEERYLRSLARLLVSPASWRAFVVEQRALVRDLPDIDNQLHRIVTPTVVVAGAADRIVPTAANEALAAQIPGAEFVLLRRAGHLLPHRQPERLAEIIEARVRSSS
jgi:pimeloyl-ACP methyl ester carboxylesterase